MKPWGTLKVGSPKRTVPGTRNPAAAAGRDLGVRCPENPSHRPHPTPGLVGGFRDTARVNDLLGYARVSTADQDPALQHDALTAAGCFRVWTDTTSGAKTQRPQLDAVLDALRPGDSLVVWRIDRLGRSLPHLIETVTALGERGIHFRSLTEGFDTTTAGGEFLFHIMAALAQMERRMVVERTHAGLAAARARGRTGGRPTALTPAKRRQALKMREDGVPVGEIAEVLGVGRSTLYRHLEAYVQLP